MRNGMRFFAAFPVLCVEWRGVCEFDIESCPASQKCNAHTYNQYNWRVIYCSR